jgi:hypothetical protein
MEYTLRKLECKHNEEFIEMKKCYIEALSRDVHGFNFHVVFKKKVEKIMASKAIQILGEVNKLRNVTVRNFRSSFDL